MEEAVKKTIASDLSGLIITDHLDLNTPTEADDFVFNIKDQQEKIDKLKNKYDIQILKGIELGLQLHTFNEMASYIEGHNFDTIIASIHFVDKMDPYYGSYYINRDAEEAYGRYLETIYQCITQFKNFDVLGHYDYIARYSSYNERAILYSQFPDILDEILKFLVKEGKALEVNTNTYREKNSATPYLDINVLKRYKELGGDAVSLGSDAHDEWRIGEKFSQYKELIKSCGFKYIAHYKNREAQFTTI
jgi:histidinol-phosphatase (PHP family)